MKDLRRKIRRLEGKIEAEAIPPDDRLIVIMGHRWEKEEKANKRKAELIEKYGAECLDHFLFVDFPCFCDKCHPKNRDSG